MRASTPWFETYKAEFLRTLLFNDHETFDHPLACARLPAVVIDCMHAPGSSIAWMLHLHGCP